MISIVIPTYNRAKLIHRALDSVLAQTFTDWECIVVDDFSTDNTKDVVEQYIAKDKRFRYVVNERKKGAQGARNTGILLSSFEWIYLLDSDNIAHSDMLEKLVKRIEPEIDVINCFSKIIDTKTNNQVGTLNFVNEGDIKEGIINGNSYVDFNQAIIRKRKLMEINLLDEDCPSMQEWDTHIRLSEISRYATVKEYLVDYFINGEDAISTDKRREVKGHLYVFRKHLVVWRRNKSAVRRMVKQTYEIIRDDKNYMFRLFSFVKLAWLSPYTIKYAIKRQFPNIKIMKEKLLQYIYIYIYIYNELDALLLWRETKKHSVFGCKHWMFEMNYINAMWVSGQYYKTAILLMNGDDQRRG